MQKKRMVSKPSRLSGATPKHHHEKHPKSVFKKKTASASRWLHIYLSMVSFVIVLFFAVTGLTLNHTEWFEGKEVTHQYTGKIPLAWVNQPDTTKIAKLSIVEKFRSSFGIRGAVTEFRIDDQQCSVSFAGPGYSADGFVRRNDGSFELTETKFGLAAVLNDLHKGRDTGGSWKWVIDASAVFMAVISLTGLIMLCFMKKKRLSGFLLLLAGSGIVYAVYLWLVP